MASPGRGPVPVTRPRGVLAFLVPLLVAAGAGLALGLAPRAALAVEAGLLSTLVLVVRLEWAALVVIGLSSKATIKNKPISFPGLSPRSIPSGFVTCI